jgi:DNA-binding MarR family transcriptional regulator
LPIAYHLLPIACLFCLFACQLLCRLNLRHLLWYVQNMNNERSSDPGQHKALQILNELSDNDSLTQRDLSSRLGIALGLTNSYIKNLVAKGYVTVKSIPPRRYAYFLTPKGLAEKTRLTYHLLQDYTRIYREARSTLKKLFTELQSDGMKKVVFAGADEIAEIAYLTLQETDMELAGLVDEEMAGNKFFGREVLPVKGIGTMCYDCVVITSYLKRDRIRKSLLATDVAGDKIKGIFAS